MILAPSWRGFQSLLDMLFDEAKAIDMPFNTSKTDINRELRCLFGWLDVFIVVPLMSN